MIFNDNQENWIKGGGEVDLPRDPDDWNNLAYRSIGWNPESKRWEYFTRESSLTDRRVHYSYGRLSDLIRATNSIHKIDDEVTTEL